MVAITKPEARLSVPVPQPQRIYPDSFAAIVIENGSIDKKWRPSNGTEGELFFNCWCDDCERSGCRTCEIIGRTMFHEKDDPEYPIEWQYSPNGHPCCTAYVPIGEPIPEPRCEHTVDLFEKVTI